MKQLKRILIAISLLLINVPVFAQGGAVVPDVTGLTVPQATAELNRAGLTLGQQTSEGWTEASGLPRGAVSGQSVPAGTEVAVSSAVDVTVLQSPNMRLIYDDNDVTLINLSGGDADVTGLLFTSVEGASASFSASRWTNNLRAGQCFQLWSIGRNGAKGLPDCDFIQSWFTTNNQGEHFWTQTSGVQQFAVLDNGVQRVTCPTAPVGSEPNPLTCEFYYSGAEAGSSFTEYLFFAYTPQVIALVNQSDDKWMRTDRTTLYNFNPNSQVQNVPLVFGSPELFNEEHRVGVGDMRLLAPGQCLIMTTPDAVGTPSPLPCDVIGARTLDPTVAFWLADFEVESIADGQRRTCPMANAERPIYCIIQN